MEFVNKCKKLVWRISRKRLRCEKRVAPQGCIYVYVGAERERFLINIKITNHPLFKELLDAAEIECGHRNDGPLWLPCHTHTFCEALSQMKTTQHHDHHKGSVGCAFPMGQLRLNASLVCF